MNDLSVIKFKAKADKRNEKILRLTLTGRLGNTASISTLYIEYSEQSSGNPLEKNGFPENSIGYYFLYLGFTNVPLFQPPKRVLNTGS